MNEQEVVPIIEGKTHILVPSVSLKSKIPTKKDPVFFNSVAKLNRDLSILAYTSYLSSLNFKSTSKKYNNNNNNNKIMFADSLCGTGARGLRVAVEVPNISKVYLNDINTEAIDLAKRGAELNSVFDRCHFSVNEVCKFLVNCLADNKERFAIVDLDPFGSPAPYIDCVMRSVAAGGLVSITATDTAVLCGKYPDVCLRKYYGRPLNNSYSNETALRLLISLIALTSARLGTSINPIFAHVNLHYIRVYAKVILSSKLSNRVYENIGYLKHCVKCGNRSASSDLTGSVDCELCSKRLSFAGPLWIGEIFDKDFLKMMIRFNEYSSDNNNNSRKDTGKRRQKNGMNAKHDSIINRLLSTCIEEYDDIPYYFKSDEIAAILKTSPHSLDKIIEKLSKSGFRACKTSFNSAAFKTDARINEITAILRE